jgi:PTS system galactitol-specific IIA component
MTARPRQQPMSPTASQEKRDPPAPSDQAQLDESLVRLGLRASDNCAVMHILADMLYAHGAVKAEYGDKVCERESKYPTGLPTAGVYVAIPHADAEWVHHSAIAVATLAEPVTFYNMGDPAEKLPVEIVMMLAIADASKQVQMLQQVAQVLSDEPMLHALKDATAPSQVVQTLRQRILERDATSKASV